MKFLLPVAMLIFAAVLCYICFGILRLLSKHVSRGRLILTAGLLFGWLNFFLCFVWNFFIGGRAAEGMVENGRYYVRDGSEYTEVSPAVYWTDLWYTRISEVLFAVTGVIVGYLVLRSIRRRRTQISNEIESSEKLEKLRSQRRRIWLLTVPIMLGFLGVAWLLIRLPIPLHPFILFGAILIGCTVLVMIFQLAGCKKLGLLIWCAGFGLPLCFFIWVLLWGVVQDFQSGDPWSAFAFLLVTLIPMLMLIMPSAILSSILFSFSSKKTNKQWQAGAQDKSAPSDWLGRKS